MSDRCLGKNGCWLDVVDRIRTTKKNKNNSDTTEEVLTCIGGMLRLCECHLPCWWFLELILKTCRTSSFYVKAFPNYLSCS